MRITFTETESRERSYFEQELADHELNFGPSLADTEIFSGFIASRITHNFLAEHPVLRLIATRSTTWDHIDLDSCRRPAWRSAEGVLPLTHSLNNILVPLDLSEVSLKRCGTPTTCKAVRRRSRPAARSADLHTLPIPVRCARVR
jgi:hypothetical protein